MESASPTRAAVRPASDHSILVTFAGEISLKAHRRVRAALHLLQRAPIPGVADLDPAYASLLLTLDPAGPERRRIEDEVVRRLAAARAVALPELALVEVPVRYGGEWGPDLADVAAACGLTPAEVVREHSRAEYVVYFLGFSPGFAYLGGLPPRIAAARRRTPRTRVPAGSVAIGGVRQASIRSPRRGAGSSSGARPLRCSTRGGRRRRCWPRAIGSSSSRRRKGRCFRPRGRRPRRRRRRRRSVPSRSPPRVSRARCRTSDDPGGPPRGLGVGRRGPRLAAGRNWLVGNPKGAAAIEMTLTGAALAFPMPASYFGDGPPGPQHLPIAKNEEVKRLDRGTISQNEAFVACPALRANNAFTPLRSVRSAKNYNSPASSSAVRPSTKKRHNWNDLEIVANCKDTRSAVAAAINEAIGGTNADRVSQ